MCVVHSRRLEVCCGWVGKFAVPAGVLPMCVLGIVGVRVRWRCGWGLFGLFIGRGSAEGAGAVVAVDAASAGAGTVAVAAVAANEVWRRTPDVCACGVGRVGVGGRRRGTWRGVVLPGFRWRFEGEGLVSASWLDVRGCCCCSFELLGAMFSGGGSVYQLRFLPVIIGYLSSP